MLLGAIILARTDSRRLPRKALREVDGLPLIRYVIERAKQINCSQPLILATTDRPLDDELARYAENSGALVYRGAAADVACRALECAHCFSLDFFVRLNGDSPFLDPRLIDSSSTLCGKDCDLISNLPCKRFPYGISVEWIRTKSLERAYPYMTEANKEHLTQFFYEHPNHYRICAIKKKGPSLRNVRLVVDTPEDLGMIEKLMHQLGDRKLTACYSDVCDEYIRQFGHAGK
jgi:spore coat polysaccharide biosynthesis protein SpsF